MESFNEWMDKRHMSAEEASDVFSKSPGTIRNWRSIGVPESQREWVLKRMTEMDLKKNQHGFTPERISVEITREQLANWNRASLLAGKIIYDWAVDILDEAAAEGEATGSSETLNPLQSLKKVAEDGTEYVPLKKVNDA